jgi:D-glycero-D-manno-heptose 1,7-bisphosphate phosphatase
MGRFSVERSAVDPTQPMPQQGMQQYNTPYSSNPYAQPMPQQGMQQQAMPVGWPTVFPKEVVALDRGVIINDIMPLYSPEMIQPLPGSLEAIRMLRMKGYKVVIFFNEPLISERKITTNVVDSINQKMMEIFGQAGIMTIDGLLYSTTNMKEDIYSMPNNGMMKKAETDFKIKMKGGYFVGDKLYNLKAGDSVGMKPVLIQTGMYQETETKLTTFGNRDLVKKVNRFNSLLDFANSLN